MAIRGADTSTDEILRDARFHAAAVAANPESAHLSDPVRKASAALKTKRNTAEEAEEARTEKLAMLLRSDFELDERLRLLDLDVLKQTGKVRSSPAYRTIFPRGLSSVVAARGSEETNEVRELVKRLKESHPALHGTYATDLETLSKAVEHSEAAWQKAEAEEARAFSDEVVARLQLVRQLQKSEGALQTLYPGQRRRVRSFFRPTRRRGAVSDDASTTSGSAEPGA